MFALIFSTFFFFFFGGVYIHGLFGVGMNMWCLVLGLSECQKKKKKGKGVWFVWKRCFYDTRT